MKELFNNEIKTRYLIYVITLVLAFSSIAYELILGQALSAFFGNTVLRYSTTIGLYLLSMGIGAFTAVGKIAEKSILSLLIIEVALTVIGGGSIILLFALNSIASSVYLFGVSAYFIIIIIGILTGMEIPLLIKINSALNYDSENIILGVNYLGAFLGAVAFAFIFFPKTGLIASSLFVGLLNSFAGILLFLFYKKNGTAIYLQLALFLSFVVLLINSEAINDLIIDKYLSV